MQWMVLYLGVSRPGWGGQMLVTCYTAFRLSKSLKRCVGFLFEEILLLLHQKEDSLSASQSLLKQPRFQDPPTVPTSQLSPRWQGPSLHLFSIRRQSGRGPTTEVSPTRVQAGPLHSLPPPQSSLPPQLKNLYDWFLITNRNKFYLSSLASSSPLWPALTSALQQTNTLTNTDAHTHIYTTHAHILFQALVLSLLSHGPAMFFGPPSLPSLLPDYLYFTLNKNLASSRKLSLIYPPHPTQVYPPHSKTTRFLEASTIAYAWHPVQWHMTIITLCEPV